MKGELNEEIKGIGISVVDNILILFSEEDAKKAKETVETCYDIARQIKEVLVGKWSFPLDIPMNI